MKVSTILDHIDQGSLALPKFQRGYVWNRDQVRGLMRSLYHKHPIGGLLVWETSAEGAQTRGDGDLPKGAIRLLLDGQQRVTSLYGIIRGKAPMFFEGNTQTFTGLFFNLDEEIFEFYAPMKMKGNSVWVDVTDLMRIGVGDAIQRLHATHGSAPDFTAYLGRLNAVHSIKDIDLHIDEVTGEDKTVDVVVDIFNMVNSGGTKLSKGDLALAKICAEWPEARDEMSAKLVRWRRAGFHFRLEWLLRSVNAVVTGEALFSALKDVDTPRLQHGLKQTEKAIDSLLNLICTRLGLDHDRVLGSRYSFPVLARYIIQRGGQLSDQTERDKLLYWYVHTFLWGRYAGSTESTLNQDLALIEHTDGALDRLIEQLRQNRGDLNLSQYDFAGWSQGARFYPVLYMLTRAWHAKDWGSGVELSSHLLGSFSSLELHHIFPKAQLRKHGYSLAEINAIANFTFLTQETNRAVTDRMPEEYLTEFAAKHPGAVESHWVPMDRALWRIENYRDFLSARRELLAKAANDLLDSLIRGAVPEAPAAPDVLDREVVEVPGGIATDEEEDIIRGCNDWVIKQRLPEGELMYELVDPATGEALAILDLAWPNGLQEGLSQPVALLIDEGRETEEAANRAGYRYFKSVGTFREYVENEILAVAPTIA